MSALKCFLLTSMLAMSPVYSSSAGASSTTAYRFVQGLVRPAGSVALNTTLSGSVSRSYRKYFGRLDLLSTSPALISLTLGRGGAGTVSVQTVDEEFRGRVKLGRSASTVEVSWAMRSGSRLRLSFRLESGLNAPSPSSSRPQWISLSAYLDGELVSPEQGVALVPRVSPEVVRFMANGPGSNANLWMEDLSGAEGSPAGFIQLRFDHGRSVRLVGFLPNGRRLIASSPTLINATVSSEGVLTIATSGRNELFQVPIFITGHTSASGMLYGSALWDYTGIWSQDFHGGVNWYEEGQVSPLSLIGSLWEPLGIGQNTLSGIGGSQACTISLQREGSIAVTHEEVSWVGSSVRPTSDDVRLSLRSSRRNGFFWGTVTDEFGKSRFRGLLQSVPLLDGAQLIHGQGLGGGRHSICPIQITSLDTQ